MSRKQKAYRAWYHKANAEDMNVQRAFADGWDAHKGVAHARTIQELQAEVERLRKDADRLLWIMDNGATAYGELFHALKRTKPHWHSYDDIREAIDAATNNGETT